MSVLDTMTDGDCIRAMHTMLRRTYVGPVSSVPHRETQGDGNVTGSAVREPHRFVLIFEGLVRDAMKYRGEW